MTCVAEFQAGPRPHAHHMVRPKLLTAAARLVHQPGLLLSYLVLATVLAACLAPEIFTSVDPLKGVARERLLVPSLEHPFGTDQMGRDLYARVVHGTSESVRAVVIAVAFGLFVGSFIGLVAGYVGGWVDDVFMRVMDVLLAVPTLLIALAIISAIGFGTTNIAIAVGIGTVASFARVMRSEVLKVRAMPYVEATAFAGISRVRVLLRHVVPNAVGPVFVLAALELGIAILSVSALSFLGFGTPPPAPEWGALVAGGRDFMRAAWWLTALPGLVIALTVLAANRVARSLDEQVGGTF